MFGLLLCPCSHLTDTRYETTIRYSYLQPHYLNYNSAIDRFILPFCSPTHLVQRTFLKWKVLMHAFQRSLLRLFVYVLSHTFLCLMLIVIGIYVFINVSYSSLIFINTSMYLWISVVFVVFFLCERIRSFRTTISLKILRIKLLVKFLRVITLKN